TAPASVLVKAPAGVLKVNGQTMPRRSPEETFLTPALPEGREHAYEFVLELTVDGKPVVRRERITVRAGGTAVVDLTREVAPRGVARVTVVTPGKARLTVNGVAVGTVQSRRSFETPALEPGRSYAYEVSAEIEDGDATRTINQRITVEAGKEV